MFQSRRSARGVRVVAGAVLALVGSTGSIHAQSWGQYGVTVYVPPPQFFASQIGAVNNSGQVPGQVGALPSIFTPTAGVASLPTTPTTSSAAGYGINNLGEVVGYSSQSAPQRATLWAGGAPIDVGTLGGSYSNAWSINDLGQVVGEARDATGVGYRAFLWSASGMLDLGTFGGQTSTAYDINNNGQVTGTANTASGSANAFLWDNGVMQNLGTLGGVASVGYGVNTARQVAGYSYSASGAQRAFLWSSGAMQDLGTLGGIQSLGFDISDAGQVVGVATDPANVYRAALWENTPGGYQAFDINSIVNDGIVNSGWELNDARGISDNGDWILARGRNTQLGYTGYVVLEANAPPPMTSAPEPASMTLMATGLAGVAGVARRRKKRTAA